MTGIREPWALWPTKPAGGEAARSALRDALVDQYAARFEIEEAELDPETLGLAHRLAPDHRVAVLT